jgi:asparaginyl-tRNA synthetase
MTTLTEPIPTTLRPDRRPLTRRARPRAARAARAPDLAAHPHRPRAQSRMLAAARGTSPGRASPNCCPPIIGPVTDPGARGAKQVDVDYYGHRYKLMTSAILYKQASLLTFDKIFYIAPNVRLEPLETANTDRHLAEFHQIDVEIGRRRPGRDHGGGRGSGRAHRCGTS